jgi:hypothetical protein
MLIYRIFEDYEKGLQLLENYSRCRFDIVSDEFEKMKEKLNNDPLVTNNFMKINRTLKNNIIEEVIKSSSTVPISYLSNLVKENDTQKIESAIIMLIGEGRVRAKIDDIEKVVFSHEISSMTATYNKTIEFAKKVYGKSLEKIISSVIVEKPKLKEEDKRNIKEIKS